VDEASVSIGWEPIIASSLSSLIFVALDGSFVGNSKILRGLQVSSMTCGGIVDMFLVVVGTNEIHSL
jgi:hypothetical protein